MESEREVHRRINEANSCQSPAEATQPEVAADNLEFFDLPAPAPATASGELEDFSIVSPTIPVPLAAAATPTAKSPDDNIEFF
jgi:hypothetical protein